MSGSIVETPSSGAAWATWTEMMEGIRKGLIPLSLTNYDATTVPQIASGSWIEAAGAIYKFTSNDTISGTPSSGQVNYVTMVPSGTGASAIVTPTWSTSAPTWSDAYQGFYSGTTRYAAAMWYDGTNYVSKSVYTNRHAGPKTRYYSPSFSFTSEDLAEMAMLGDSLENGNPGGFDQARIAVILPQGAIVTELYSYCSAFTDGTHQVELIRSAHTAATETQMATVTHSGTGELTDTTITSPVIDNETYGYFIEFDPSTGGTATLSGIRLEYIEIVRC